MNTSDWSEDEIQELGQHYGLKTVHGVGTSYYSDKCSVKFG